MYITKGDDLELSVEFTGSLDDEEELSVSLMHDLRGIETDLSDYIKYDVTPVSGQTEQWTLEALLPYPFSLNTGNMNLRLANDEGSDDTNTELFVEEMGGEDPPFFDPAPKNVKSYPSRYGPVRRSVGRLVISAVGFVIPLHISIVGC